MSRVAILLISTKIAQSKFAIRLTRLLQLGRAVWQFGHLRQICQMSFPSTQHKTARLRAAKTSAFTEVSIDQSCRLPWDRVLSVADFNKKRLCCKIGKERRQKSSSSRSPQGALLLGKHLMAIFWADKKPSLFQEGLWIGTISPDKACFHVLGQCKL